jgi:error-prone DNA polymerase
LGTVNLVVPPAVYERDRLAVRTEPLVVAEGKLERFAAGGGAISVLVHRLAALDAPAERERPAADVLELPAPVPAEAPAEAEGETADGTGDFRAVAPPVMNFAQGRGR